MPKDPPELESIPSNLLKFQGSVGKLEKAIADIQAELPLILELKKLEAQACRAYYLELLAQGFSEPEALTLAGQMQL